MEKLGERRNEESLEETFKPRFQRSIRSIELVEKKITPWSSVYNNFSSTRLLKKEKRATENQDSVII